MDTINDIKLKYSCAAYPPFGLKLNTEYLISKQKDGFHITDGNYDKALDLNFIKMCFNVEGSTWDSVSDLLK